MKKSMIIIAMKQRMEMFKKLRFLFFTGVLFICFMPLAAGAYNINYDYTADGNEFTSPYYYATIENFNSGAVSLVWTGSSSVVLGSVGGKYSAPDGVDGVNKDDTYYVTVPEPASDGSGSVMVTGLPVGTYNYFGLWWGSMDTYNTVAFYLNGISTGESFTGSDVTIAGPANGNQIAPATNHYVNFLDLKPYNSFSMSSTQFAFEADNIAIGYNPTRAPEPTTMLLLGLGLVGVAALRKKF